jgi:hypothetical protein
MARTARTPKRHTYRKVTDTHYIYDSNHYTLVGYQVRHNGHEWTCTCEGYFRHYRCSHLREHAENLAATYKSVATRLGLTLEGLFDQMV